MSLRGNRDFVTQLVDEIRLSSGHICSTRQVREVTVVNVGGYVEILLTPRRTELYVRYQLDPDYTGDVTDGVHYAKVIFDNALNALVRRQLGLREQLPQNVSLAH